MEINSLESMARFTLLNAPITSKKIHTSFLVQETALKISS